MNKPKSRYFTEQIDGIVHEVSKLAIACDIDFFAPDAAERVLNNDETVCRRKNTAAFVCKDGHFINMVGIGRVMATGIISFT